ncbi:MAG: hypothetical protein DRJ68_05165 [Thermoprotei archaeon]|nr:MAG: hypothetical protein DRJ62_00970 [Thermoprotei archaeon]RLF20233.1 MAG: hypothetical protein DRJ68_05165 [Thermoprotei archaeon]
MSTFIKKLLIDALKPREIPITELSKAICAIKGVEEVNIVVTEVDARTETVKITVMGSDIDFEEVSRVMAENSAAIRSVDEVTVSKVK